MEEDGVQRVFLGWHQSALASVVDYALNRYEDGSVWDLSGVVVVVPGARAGRRLSEQLAVTADRRQVAYFPPIVTTVGQLPELLYERRRPFASSLTQQLVWTESLRRTEGNILRQFLRDVPESKDDPRWWELGTLLWRQYRELAAEGLDFPQVARAGAELFGPGEQARWHALARVQQIYLRRLDALQLWDRQTARIFAIDHHECQTNCDLLLVATVDINRTQRLMLDQVRSRVTALVYADEAASEMFDEYGCLCPSQWRHVEIPLGDDQIRVVERQADQATEVLRFLNDLNGQFTADQVAVGVPDETLVPLIQRQLDQAGVPSRYGPGRPVEATRPLRLIRCLLQYLETNRLADLADAVRHPDLRAWLLSHDAEAVKQCVALDAYCGRRLIATARQAVVGEDHESVKTRRLIGAVKQLLAPLVGPARKPSDWVPDLLALLAKIYGPCELDPDDLADRMVLGGCETFRDAVLELQRLPDEVVSPVSVSEAVLMALDTVPKDHVPAPRVPDAVELLGWLELTLDDAPALVVTQVNEGSIPTSASSDLFLPDKLRAYLGLIDNARRYARDAYAMTVLARTRQKLVVIVGRRDDQANPLLPSRLLFATGAAGQRRRCLRLFGEATDGDATDGDATDGEATDSIDDGAPTDSIDDGAPTPTREPPREHSSNQGAQPVGSSPDRHRFFVPRPEPQVEIDTLSVTDFKAYLQCPYRFYLTRVLKLQSVVREPGEIDGAAFGTLLHKILERFGTSSARDSADEQEIREVLLASSRHVFLRQFGATPPPVVLIQEAQLRLRLEAFARQQAAWRNDGWRIVMTEGEGELRSVTTRWMVDGVPINLRGRIDRIDQHDSGQYVILDYKSAEEGRTPRSAHNVGSGRGPAGPDHWKDLQLPLYRHLAAELGLAGDLALGLVNLPRTPDQSGFKLADWTTQELQGADEAARQVVRAIREGVFWEPAGSDGGFDPGLDRICQVHVFDWQWEGTEEVAPGAES